MRRDDWDARLYAAIDSARTKPFKWGTHDCALFSADAVLAMTGVDYAANFRGRYRTRSGALRLLATQPLRARVSAVFGAASDVKLARRGDVVCSADGALGICIGELSVFVGPLGVEMLPTLGAECAWRVE